MLYRSDETRSGTNGATVWQANGRSRNYKKPTNPNTAKQSRVRANFGENSTTYKRLGSGQQEGWALAALSYPRTNRVGNTYTLSPSAFYNSVNQNVMQLKEQIGDENTEDKLITPPTPSSISYPSLKEQIGENEEESMVIGMSGSAGSMVTDVSYVVVYATAPMSKGRRNAGKSLFRMIGAYTKAQMTTAISGAGLDIGDKYLVQFNAYPVAGTRYFVRFEGIEKNEGVYRSIGQIPVDTVVATP